MINLAKSPIAKNDEAILEELFVAGIDVLRDDTRLDAEVSTHITGVLRRKSTLVPIFRFQRAWYYWMVEGNVPLAVAEAMYAQEPYGKRDVRVAGHCGCPPPKEWAVHFTAEGKRVFLFTGHDLELHRSFKDGTLSPSMRAALSNLFLGNEGPIVETEAERDAITALRAVTNYHIDSQAGLKVFVDTLRTHGIVE